MEVSSFYDMHILQNALHYEKQASNADFHENKKIWYSFEYIKRPLSMWIYSTSLVRCHPYKWMRCHCQCAVMFTEGCFPVAPSQPTANNAWAQHIRRHFIHPPQHATEVTAGGCWHVLPSTNVVV